MSWFTLAPLLLSLIAPDPRLERTAHDREARELAAEVLVEADAIADLVLMAHAAVFELEQGGARRELRLELACDGTVIGASVWWIGVAEGDRRDDLALALPALAGAGSLDAITLEDDVLALRAGDATVPLGGDLTDELEDVW